MKATVKLDEKIPKKKSLYRSEESKMQIKRDIDLCLNCKEKKCKGYCKLFKYNSNISRITQKEKREKLKEKRDDNNK